MMASITSFSKKGFRAADFLHLIFLVSWLLLASQASAKEATAIIERAAILYTGGDYVLNADIDFEFAEPLIKALEAGVELSFVVDLSVERRRWYWLNKDIANLQREYKLSYHVITGRYRLSAGRSYGNFDTLEGALANMKRIRYFPVAPLSSMSSEETYAVNLRFYLDLDKLPNPFKFSVGSNDGWNIKTESMKWNYRPVPAAKP